MVRGEIRSFHHDKALQCLNEINALFRLEAEQAGAFLDWTEEVHCIAYETGLNSRVAERYREACEATGITAEFIKTFGGSDHNVFATKGIEGLVISNAMNCVHSCNEYTEVEELIKSTQIVRNLMISAI